jgi:hypothetical protein
MWQYKIPLTALLLYQSYISFRVAQSTYYSSRQKAIQIGPIWLVPLVVALICHVILASMRRPLRGRDREFVRDDNVNPPGMG